MMVILGIDELRSALGGARAAFVPTMGALHAGHVALIHRAAEIGTSAGAPVVVSIFVNPTQFGPSEDFSRYPRMLDADVAAAVSAGATIIFAPEVETMYPPNKPVPVPVLPVVATEPKLEDAHRPTHFAGVCQVVARLFDLVQPAAAVFGEKDYQQLLVVTAMVAQERGRWPGLQIIAHPTVRESDGLAMSSRNAYLKPEDRERAVGLITALKAAGMADDPASAEHTMLQILTMHGLQIDYAVVRNAATLRPVAAYGHPMRGLIAARLGKVRLIDNLPIR